MAARIDTCLPPCRQCHHQRNRIDGVFWRRLIDPDHLLLTQAAGMTLTGLLVLAGTLSADGDGLTAVTLIGRDETNVAAAVLAVVQVH